MADATTTTPLLRLKEVELTQYIRPGGRRETVSVLIPEEVADKAAGMALSCEVLLTGQVAIYGRFKDEDEDDEHLELATNSPGPRQPDLVTATVIEKVWLRRNRAAE